MAIKPPDLLNRLPSVSELLEKPPIRALAERWNRSVVAGNVRKFLEEMATDLRRRAADMPLPPIRELAERAARFVVSQQQSSLGTAINATGSIWGTQWKNVPLADVALERAIAVGREFAMEPATQSGASAANVESLLCRLTGGQAAVVVNSYISAVWLSLAALAADREVLIARADVGEVGLANPLPKLAAAAGVFLKEVGTTNRTAVADYEAAASPRAAAILQLDPDTYRVVGETSTPQLSELVTLARGRKLTLIQALGTAPIIDPPSDVCWPQQSVKATLDAGVDVAIVRGDGLIGGPECGVLIGTQEIIHRIMQHPSCPALELDPLRSAALIATLGCYDNSPNGIQAIPVWQFLTVPLENLRNRAERMAPQLAQAIGVATATALEMHSQLFPAMNTHANWPSCGVALAPADGNIQGLASRLRTGSPPIVGRIESERLVLDLRTVLPRQDKLLVDALLNEPAVVPDRPAEGTA